MHVRGKTHVPFAFRALFEAPPLTAADAAADTQQTFVPGWPSSAHDEELQISVDRRSLVWSSGSNADGDGSSRVLLTHTVHNDADILQLLLCRFADTGERPWLVCVQPDVLTVFGVNGDMHTVSLPCKAVRCFALLEGLLIQRAISASEYSNSNNNNISNSDNGNSISNNDRDEKHSSLSPILFSLLHPLEELKPVSSAQYADHLINCDSNSSSNNHCCNHTTDATQQQQCISNITDFLCDVHEHVVWSCAAQPLLLTFNARSERHRLWLIRQSQAEIEKRLHNHVTSLRSSHCSSSSSSSGSGSVDSSNDSSSDDISHDSSNLRNGMQNYAKHELYQQLLTANNQQHVLDTRAITSELILQCVWQEEEQLQQLQPYAVKLQQQHRNSMHSNVFLAGDIYHKPLLCMYNADSQQLLAYHLSTVAIAAAAAGPHHQQQQQLQLQFAFRRSCLAAVPCLSLWNVTAVHSRNPYNNDIVVLEHNNSLVLYTGSHRVTEVVMDVTSAGAVAVTADFISNCSNKKSSSVLADFPLPLADGSRSYICHQQLPVGTVVDISNSICNRITVTTVATTASLEQQLRQQQQSQQQLQQHRVAVTTGFRSVLLCRCLQSLAMLLPSELMHMLRVDVVAAINYNTRRLQLQQLPATALDEFVVFVNIVHQLMGVPLVVANHRSNSSSNSSKRSWKRSSRSNYSQSKPIVRQMMIRLSRQQQQPQQPSFSYTAASVNTDQAMFQQHLFGLLLALHTLYEDNKLNVLLLQQQERQPQLQQLLMVIAVELELVLYIEHYHNDGAAIISKYSSSSSSRRRRGNYQISRQQLLLQQQQQQQEPLSMQKWMLASMSHANFSNSDSSNSDNFFDLLLPMESPFELSRKVRMLYSCLFRSKNISNQLQSHQPHKQQKQSPKLTATSKQMQGHQTPMQHQQQEQHLIFTPAQCNIDEQSNSHSRNNHRMAATHQSLTPASPFTGFQRLSASEQEQQLPLLSPVSQAKQQRQKIFQQKHSSNHDNLLSGKRQSCCSNLDRSCLLSELPAHEQAVLLLLQPTNSSNFSSSAASTTDALLLLMLLPVAVTLPLREAIQMCRQAATTASTAASSGDTTTAVGCSSIWWTAEAYNLIGRYDLARMSSSKQPPQQSSVLQEQQSLQLQQSQQQQLEEEQRQLECDMQAVAGGNSCGMLSAEQSSNSYHSRAGSRIGTVDDTAASTADDDLDGLLLVVRRAALQFAADQRLKEVRHLLNSNRLVCVTISKSSDNNNNNSSDDHENGSGVSAQQQARLSALALRIYAISVGRGMFTLATAITATAGAATAISVAATSTPSNASATSQLLWPAVTVRGRIASAKNATLEYDSFAAAAAVAVATVGAHADVDAATAVAVVLQASNSGHSDVIGYSNGVHWPSFHNGVAAGLRITPSTQHSNSHSYSSSYSSNSSHRHQVTRPWILFNRPAVGALNSTHAGWLLALGLHQHLSVLTPADLYWYLSQNHDATTVAVLLGMAATQLGTQDHVTSRMLFLHIPVLLTTNVNDYSHLSGMVQTAALLSVGLLYCRTAHRFMCELLCDEISRQTNSDNDQQQAVEAREGYALAAGCALGLITLARGSSISHGDNSSRCNQRSSSDSSKGNNKRSDSSSSGLDCLLDLGLEDRLSEYMNGGSVSGSDGEGSNSHGSYKLHHHNNHNHNNNKSSHQYGSAHHSSYRNNKHSSSSRHSPSPSHPIHVDVTSPGATIALCLMYLQSNNTAVAHRIVIPDTTYTLNGVRPDFLLLRVCARSLILWQSIEATAAWVEEQVPLLISSNVQPIVQLKTTATTRAGSAHHQRSNSSNKRKLALDDPVSALQSKHNSSRHQSGSTMLIYDIRDTHTVTFTASNETHQRPEAVEMPAVAAEVPAAAAAQVAAAAAAAAAAASSTSSIRLPSHLRDLDMQAVRQSYVNIIAGSCFAIGLRYAGTAQLQAQQLLARYVRAFRSMKRKRKSSSSHSNNNSNNNSNSNSNSHSNSNSNISSSSVKRVSASTVNCTRLFTQWGKLDAATLDLCTHVTALSLSLVMAGTGDLPTLQLLKSLRLRVNASSTTYGSQMSLHCCFGFLFLGGGALTLSNQPLAVAALLIALYPHWPSTTADNRHHLQALRHLYVIAVQPRHIQTRDVATGKACSVAIQITGTTASATATDRSYSSSMTTPCLLPPLGDLQQLTVSDDRFWSFTLDIQHNETHRSLLKKSAVIWVQRKTSSNSHSRSKNSSRKSSGCSSSSTVSHLILSDHLLLSHDSQPVLASFARHFANSATAGTGCSSSSSGSLVAYSEFVLQWCGDQEAAAMLSTHMYLHRLLHCMLQQSLSATDSQHLHSVCRYYIYKQQQQQLVREQRPQQLLHGDFVAAVANQATMCARFSNHSSHVLPLHTPSRAVFITAAKQLSQQLGSAVGLLMPAQTLLPLLTLQFPLLSASAIRAMLDVSTAEAAATKQQCEA